MRKIVPDDDAGGDRDIHGMLGAELRDFQATVTGIDDFLTDTFHLVAEDNCVFFIRKRCEVLQHRGAVGLFDG